MLAFLGWALVAFWAVALTPVLAGLLRPRRLSQLPETLPADMPTLTVVVAARNEEAAIGRTLSDLLAQTYAPMSVVVVNDRSDDRTGEILDELAAADERLKVVHVDALPDGWLGKNHANFVGAAQSDSEYILFTDGDVEFHPEALARSMHHLVRDGADHLTMMPRMHRGSVFEDALIGAFTFFFGLRFQPWLARGRSKHFYVGVGAFNLVRRSAYEAFGGHRPLRMEVVDDVKLGKLMKANGFRQDVALGDPWISLRWQEGVVGIIRGLEKNSFAAIDYSILKTASMSIGMLLTVFLPFAGVFFATGAVWWAYASVLAFMHFSYALSLWRTERPPLYFPLFFYASVIMLIIQWRSAWVTLRQGGIRWRDTFYPIEELRRGLV